MLCNWESHVNYQKKLLLNLKLFCEIERSRVISMGNALSKLYLLDLDNLLPVIKPLYSDFGRPAENQQGIIRSLVLMLDSNEHSIAYSGTSGRQFRRHPDSKPGTSGHLVDRFDFTIKGNSIQSFSYSC